MKKRLYLSSIQDNLAKDMWGNIKKRIEFVHGIVQYNCEDYKGYIFNDKQYTLDKKLRKNLKPIVVLEEYSFRKDKFIIERTDKKEKIPKKLLKKYSNNRYDNQINIYSLTEKSMNILKYYCRDLLKYAYNNKIYKDCNNYSSMNGYINKEVRESIRYLSMYAPEFIKKKDVKKGKKYINKIMNKAINDKNRNGNIKDNDLEIIKDKYYQRIEILSR